MTHDPFDITDLRRAAARIEGRIVRTPLLHSPMLDELAGCRLFVKAEPLQLTGSFKIRGALNKGLSMDPARARAGFVAFSAGNHGQAIAATSKMLGCPAVIVMPRTAPQTKVANCRWWGAEVVLYDPLTEDRTAIARRLAEERGMTVVSPFDDYEIIAGQGTCGLEIVEQLNELQVVPDVVVANCSGGGMAAGLSVACGEAFANTKIVIVEILGFEKMARSIASGVPESNPSVPSTILDGIAGPIAGERPLGALRRYDVTGVGVNDDDALAAMAAAFKLLKLVVEPAGAAGLAAVLARRLDVAGKNVVVVASGGNVDPGVFGRALKYC